MRGKPILAYAYHGCMECIRYALDVVQSTVMSWSKGIGWHSVPGWEVSYQHTHLRPTFVTWQ